MGISIYLFQLTKYILMVFLLFVKFLKFNLLLVIYKTGITSIPADMEKQTVTVVGDMDPTVVAKQFLHSCSNRSLTPLLVNCHTQKDLSTNVFFLIY